MHRDGGAGLLTSKGTQNSMIDDKGRRSRECARNALGTLPGIERWLCGGLISRQLDRGPRIPREVEKYGPEGCVRLCSTRAFHVYTLLFGVPAVGLAGAHVTPGAIGLITLAGLTGTFGVARGISAIAAGRRWRSRSHTP